MPEKQKSAKKYCESSCHSLYINHKGEYAPCSFTDGDDYSLAGDWRVGIDMTCDGISFIRDVWNHERTRAFRAALLGNRDEFGVRKCPLYENI